MHHDDRNPRELPGGATKQNEEAGDATERQEQPMPRVTGTGFARGGDAFVQDDVAMGRPNTGRIPEEGDRAAEKPEQSTEPREGSEK